MLCQSPAALRRSWQGKKHLLYQHEAISTFLLLLEVITGSEKFALPLRDGGFKCCAPQWSYRAQKLSWFVQT